jgi:hypothetical protein
VRYATILLFAAVTGSGASEYETQSSQDSAKGEIRVTESEKG